MRPFSPASISLCTAIALTGASIAAWSASAQSQLPRPSQLPPAGGQAQQTPARPQQPQAAPAPAPAKPYKPVAVTLPAPMQDQNFETFRKQLGEAARKKDRAALAKLVVTQGFFWDGESGDKADKKKSAIDNLAAAIRLTGADAEGWDLLAGYASDPTAAPLPDRQGVVCSPADPSFDDKALESLAKATQTDPGEWGYPVINGVEVHASTKADSAVIDKLGMYFVRVMPEQEQNAASAQSQTPMIRIVTPSGKTGFVSGDTVAPLGNDQLCYVKAATGWKITGFIGGGE